MDLSKVQAFFILKIYQILVANGFGMWYNRVSEVYIMYLKKTKTRNGKIHLAGPSILWPEKAKKSQSQS